MNFDLILNHSKFPSQYNTPVMLKIYAGSLNNQSIVYTNFWWKDPPPARVDDITILAPSTNSEFSNQTQFWVNITYDQGSNNAREPDVPLASQD